ncbi:MULTISPECIES: DUF7878 domain-containing protein [unclassified Lysinibacillus]|uniref:DUF7878 domain-containing protein n=1 Tax=unclassified Lysinibacillus TaxID=2636778 RepID=UPI00116C4EA8|nr:hypothetical protein [Lysinibacillus sp. CD3-6]QPQ36275.1 hypothetical protein JNUCC52_04920 [Lysinibacillus sp. JNUCC-52]UED82062.1 hypothetical protein FH508_0009255 [Lysinibacillus sp. CD3-6]
MDGISSKIKFEYEFLSESDAISNKDKRNVSLILGVEAIFKIKINEALYFEEELAFLEFYKSLYVWKERIKEIERLDFHYYSVEYDDYKDGAIISLIPFSNKARLKSIWAKSNVYNVFDLDYIVNEFLVLEKKLKEDIESYFNIELGKFIKHIPYSKQLYKFDIE